MLRPIAIALRLLGKVTRPQNNIIVLRTGVTTWSRKTGEEKYKVVSVP